MNTRTALRKSQLIAPAELALQRASTQVELEDAWFDYCDGFTDASPERKELLGIYNARLTLIRSAEQACRGLRV